jgi:hypothetical protein
MVLTTFAKDLGYFGKLFTNAECVTSTCSNKTLFPLQIVITFQQALGPTETYFLVAKLIDIPF